MTQKPHALRIRMLRKAKGLSQEELADEAGLSRSQLSEIETGAKPANTLRLAAIARVLGVQPRELFDAPQEDWAVEMLELMGRLTSDGRESVIRIVRAMAAARTSYRPRSRVRRPLDGRDGQLEGARQHPQCP